MIIGDHYPNDGPYLARGAIYKKRCGGCVFGAVCILSICAGLIRDLAAGFRLMGGLVAVETGNNLAVGANLRPHSRGTIGYLFLAGLCLLALAGFLTHLTVTALQGSWWLLALGILFFPFGVGNGWVIWLGWL